MVISGKAEEGRHTAVGYKDIQTTICKISHNDIAQHEEYRQPFIITVNGV